MKSLNKDLLFTFFRYFTVLLFGFGNLFLIYFIFTPLTIGAFYGIITIFANANLIGNIISFGGNFIEIIPACVAGSAYYLLFSLAMLTRMNYKTRIKIILLSVCIFFAFNIARLLFLTLILNTPSFEAVHWLSWNIISTIFIVLLWVFMVRKYKISSVPVYSDLVYIKKNLKRKKSKRKK